MHDRLYNIVDIIVKHYNPCQFNDKGECLRYQSGLRWPDTDDTACCGSYTGPDSSRCAYASDKGCTIKCLSCKMWFCTYIREKNPLPAWIDAILHNIWLLASEHGCWHLRTPHKNRR
jgi:hypothetical protein